MKNPLSRTHLVPGNPDLIMPLLRQHGAGSLSYSALQAGMQWFIEPDRGFVQYENLDLVAHNAICLGDPVCAPDQRQSLISEFLKSFHDPIFIHITRDVGSVFNAMGFFVNEMGVETVLDVQTYSIAGVKKDFLRSQKNRALKDDVKVAELGKCSVSIERLKSISDEWITAKAQHNHELAFLVRPAVFADEPDVRKFVALRGDDVIGFVFFDPMYRDGKIYGYMANILRTLGHHSYSVTDFIILEALSQFKAEGLEELSLGFSPFYGIDDSSEFNHSKPLSELFKLTFEHANHLYHFKSLAFHKDRYRPDLPGARKTKVYAATKHALPLICLYGIFLKMGIRPITQTADHAVHNVEEMIKHIPEDARNLIRHWRHAEN